MGTEDDKHAFRENKGRFDERQGKEGGVQDRRVGEVIAWGKLELGRRWDVEKSKQDS